MNTPIGDELFQNIPCRVAKFRELAATLRGSRPGVQSASFIMTSLIEKNGDHLAP